MAPAFGWMSLAGFIAMLFGIFVLISAVVGVHPPIAAYFNAFWMPIAYGLGLALVCFIIGMVAGKVARR